jgi:hypothetical protein
MKQLAILLVELLTILFSEAQSSSLPDLQMFHCLVKFEVLTAVTMKNGVF